MRLVKYFSAVAVPALCVAAICAPQAAGAADAQRWLIESTGSEVSFVSVKSGDIAEAHTISQVSGSVVPHTQLAREAAGSLAPGGAEVNVTVHLASVDTRIAIRDERIREHLFETARFPTAKVHGHLPLDEYLALTVGDSVSSAVELTLDLHGAQMPLTLEVLVARLGNDRVMITSTRPVIIDAARVGLVAGIEKLRELAGLPSISQAVPVSFVLTLVREA